MIAVIKRPDVPLEGLSLLTFDEDYMRKLREADSTVQQHFVAYFSRLILAKLRANLRSEELIKDVCQCTFLRVLEKLRLQGGIEHPERLAAFVLGVCNNVVREMIRQEQRHAPMDDAVDPPDERADTTRKLVNDERKRLVTGVLRGLSAKDRSILHMLFLEEVEKDAICSRFGVERDYLRVLVFRARGRFRAALLKSRGQGLKGDGIRRAE